MHNLTIEDVEEGTSNIDDATEKAWVDLELNAAKRDIRAVAYRELTIVDINKE